MSECAGEDCTHSSHEKEPVDAAKAMAAALDAQDAKQKEGQVLTEVTSLAKEEQKTGQRQKLPSPEEMAARAGSSLIQNLQQLSNLIEAKRGGKYVVSRKGMNRLLLSILDLPTDGIPVLLNSQEEKIGFAIGQRVVADRFIITQHHINEQIQEMKAQQEHQKQIAAEVAAAQVPDENNLTNPSQSDNTNSEVNQTQNTEGDQNEQALP